MTKFPSLLYHRDTYIGRIKPGISGLVIDTAMGASQKKYNDAYTFIMANLEEQPYYTREEGGNFVIYDLGGNVLYGKGSY